MKMDGAVIGRFVGGHLARRRIRDRHGAPRDEAVREGWFGPVSAVNLPRIGDVVVAIDDTAVADSSELTTEQRSARSGLANRQVTLR